MLLLTYTLHVCEPENVPLTSLRCCAGAEQLPPVQQPPPQPLQQQTQKLETSLTNGQAAAKPTPVSRQMIGATMPGAKTPPVVSSAVAAWIAATPTIAPVCGADHRL